MERKVRFILILMVLLVGIIQPTTLASVVEKLDPEVVVDRATVIVTGTYDLTKNPVEKLLIYYGYPFEVKDVYRGEVDIENLIVGLEIYDYHWMKEFQEEGGEFLLMLTEYEDNYFIPVGSRNGIVQLVDGKVYEEQSKERNFYSKFLRKNFPIALELHEDNSIPLSASYLLLVFVIVLLVFYKFHVKKYK